MRYVICPKSCGTCGRECECRCPFQMVSWHQIEYMHRVHECCNGCECVAFHIAVECSHMCSPTAGIAVSSKAATKGQHRCVVHFNKLNDCQPWPCSAMSRPIMASQAVLGRCTPLSASLRHTYLHGPSRQPPDQHLQRHIHNAGSILCSAALYASPSFTGDNITLELDSDGSNRGQCQTLRSMTWVSAAACVASAHEWLGQE